MSDWILLLPPSETKAEPPPGGPCYADSAAKKATNRFKSIQPLREDLLVALEAAMDRGLQLDQLFEAQGAFLERAIRANRNVRQAPAIEAARLYRGVLYEALQYDKLKKAQQKTFAKHALIVSALFGILAPTDLVPPYKLKITANLGGGVGKVINFWRGPVSDILREETRRKVVWDFLPEQHRRIWDGHSEFAQRHTVKFVKRVVRHGVAEWKTISHHSKELKGALVRHLLSVDASDADALADFVHPDGYAFEPSLSVRSRRESELVFAAR